MEKHFAKLKEYLGMDTEISYEEFESYFQDVMKLFNENYQDFNRQESIQGRFMMSILVSNADERAKKDKKLAKKYRKIREKSSLWAEALTLKLVKEGMSKQEIAKAEQELSDSI